MVFRSPEINNNRYDRAIRPLTIGKNWPFSGPPKGGQIAAAVLRLIQTCRRLTSIRRPV